MSSRRLCLFALVPALALAACGGGNTSPQPSGSIKVTMTEFKFDPDTVRIDVGGKVTWTYTGGGYHTVSGQGDAAGLLNGQLDPQHATYAVTFPKAGTYDYVCMPHQSIGMKGKIVVGGGAPSGGHYATGNWIEPTIVTDVTNELAWARRAFREIVLARLREVCASDEEFRAEARDLLGIDPA